MSKAQCVEKKDLADEKTIKQYLKSIQKKHNIKLIPANGLDDFTGKEEKAIDHIQARTSKNKKFLLELV